MPNIYHTPNIFLPKNDRRKVFPDPEILKTQTAQQLAPPMKGQQEKRYHLVEEDLELMRRLRKDAPFKWSVSRLAKRFDCSPVFVMFVTEGLSEKKQEMQKLVTQVVKSRWGIKRREAREDREFRKERWFRDE